MSTSYNAGVILGVKASDLGLKIQEFTNTYEVHDKKGNPTGKFEKEIIKKMTFNYKVIERERLYNEDFENMVDVKKPLYVFYNYEELNADNIIVGIYLSQRSYNDYNIINEISLDRKEEIKNEIKNQFGIDIEPKLYFYFYIS